MLKNWQFISDLKGNGMWPKHLNVSQVILKFINESRYNLQEILKLQIKFLFRFISLMQPSTNWIWKLRKWIPIWIHSCA